MIRYRKEIDGLRAVAVLGVFFFHLGWASFSGGWLGVDIFFVISGYLISSLLLKEMDSSGTVSLSGFYQRRLRRIMPALLFCLLGSFPMALIISKTYIFTEYSQSLAAALLSFSNIFFWQHSGYFAIDAQLAPLLHTWTLGVEEQFYLIIPLLFVFMATLRNRQRGVFLGGLFFVALASFFACRYGTDLMSVSFRFYMLPTRGWELLIGLFTAVLLHYKPEIRTKNRITETLSVASLCFVAFAFFNYKGGSFFAEKALFTTLATAVFIGTTTESSLFGRALSLRPVRFIGQISYSLYLWHWPFIFLWNLAALRFGLEPTIVSQLAILAAAVGTATLSWRFVETPFRKKSSWAECIKPLAPLALLVFVLAGYGSFQLGGDKTAYAVSDEGAAHFTSFRGVEKDEYYHMGPAGTPQFILVGDSHAKAASPALVELSKEYGIPGEAAMKDGTGPLKNIRRSHKTNAPPFAERWEKYILNGTIKKVVLIAKWDRYYGLESWKYLGSSSEWTVETAMKEMRDMVILLLDNGFEVWILDEVPQFQKDPILLTKIFDNKPYVEEVAFRENVHFARKALAGISSPGLHMLDPYPALTEDGLLSAVQNDHFMYTDNSHLSTAGALSLKDVFRPLFESIKVGQ